MGVAGPTVRAVPTVRPPQFFIFLSFVGKWIIHFLFSNILYKDLKNNERQHIFWESDLAKWLEGVYLIR